MGILYREILEIVIQVAAIREFDSIDRSARDYFHVFIETALTANLEARTPQFSVRHIYSH